MIQGLKPNNPSRLGYFQLSKEYDKQGLLYRDYRKLLWYREHYEKIEKTGNFFDAKIRLKKRK